MQLSITEYRKRHKGATANEDGCAEGRRGPQDTEGGPEWSSESSGGSGAGLSPQRLDAAAQAAADELEQRLHRDLSATHLPKGNQSCPVRSSFSLL